MPAPCRAKSAAEAGCAPLRIRVLSDLHLEAAPFDPPAAAADVVVLAGDIHNGAAGVEWAQRTFEAPVLYVAGNHEPYDGEFHATAGGAARCRAGTRRPGARLRRDA